MDVLATSPFAPGSNPSDPTLEVFLVTKIQRHPSVWALLPIVCLLPPSPLSPSWVRPVGSEWG